MIGSIQGKTGRVQQRLVSCRARPIDALVSFHGQPGCFALESVCDTGGYGRLSIFGCRPVAWIGNQKSSPGAVLHDPLGQLEAALTASPQVEASDAPFVGGWVGYIPYEAAEGLENLGIAADPRARVRRPQMGLYDAAVIFDHSKGCWILAAVDLPQSREPASLRLDRLEALLNEPTDPSLQTTANSPVPFADAPNANMTHREYLDSVARAQHYISAGDIYQVNLTQRFAVPFAGDPLDLYLRLRQANPADFAAYLPYDHRVVLSCSPELFLQVDGRRVVTRPIKGTAPRDDDAAADSMQRAKLVASEKDRAELNMIIDLLRNDLGRVCEYGTVRVLADADVEVHPTVLHLVATIEGQLRSGVSQVDLLRAAFPGGSITGCPKIRAMQIIRELEPTPRDVYCGAIGFIDLRHRMTMSIAIRTMLIESQQAHVYAGGAITADSDPHAEYQEILAKAGGMFAALGIGPGDVQPRVATLAPELESVR